MAIRQGELVGLLLGWRIRGHGYHLQMGNGLEHELAQQQGDLGRREDVIYRHVIDRAPRHSLVEGRPERLHDGDTFPLFDGEQPGGAVVEITRQHHTDDPGSKAVGGCAEERIESGAVPVFLGSLRQPSVAITEKEVVIGRSYVDSAGFDGLAVTGMRSDE
jgi:hypothetical protein